LKPPLFSVGGIHRFFNLQIMIEVRNIVKRFGQVEVLKGINLDIARGGVTSIVGPSGAGKTTLLQIIGSLTSPDAGSVNYDGTDIFRLKDNALSRFRNRNIGFVFQFHQLLPEFNMIENVAMPAIIAGSSRKEAFDRAAKLIDYLGLKSRMTHRPGELSGGECQRAAVARALINDPKVVLADEPTGSLDSHNRAELHRLFFDLRRDLGATFIIVTHDENLAADCDRIIKMQDGHVDDIIDKSTEPTEEADADINADTELTDSDALPTATELTDTAEPTTADTEPDIIVSNNPD
jgi:lipoprotein-releasing system ATP-binding protein